MKYSQAEKTQILEKFANYINNNGTLSAPEKAEYHVVLNNLKKYYLNENMENGLSDLELHINNKALKPRLDFTLNKLNVNMLEIILTNVDTTSANFNAVLESISKSISKYKQSIKPIPYNELKKECIEALEKVINDPQINKNHPNVFVNIIRNILELFNCTNLLNSFNNRFPTKDRKTVIEAFGIFNINSITSQSEIPTKSQENAQESLHDVITATV